MSIEELHGREPGTPVSSAHRPPRTPLVVATAGVIGLAIGFAFGFGVGAAPEPEQTPMPSPTPPLISDVAIAPALWRGYREHTGPRTAVVCLVAEELSCQGVELARLGRPDMFAPWENWSAHAPARLSPGRVIVGLHIPGAQSDEARLLGNPDLGPVPSAADCPRHGLPDGISEDRIAYFYDLGCLQPGRYMLVILGGQGVAMEVAG